MKRLYIVRHGAAQSSYEAGSDFARRLTPQGIARVQAVSRWLQAQPDTVAPERIIASAAPRAWETATIYAETFALHDNTLAKVKELYSGGANDYLNIVTRSLPDDISCAMAVGHNPAVSELLAAVTGAVAGEYRMRKGDAVCVAFDVSDDAPWEEVYAVDGKLERYIIASAI